MYTDALSKDKSEAHFNRDFDLDEKEIGSYLN